MFNARTFMTASLPLAAVLLSSCAEHQSAAPRVKGALGLSPLSAQVKRQDTVVERSGGALRVTGGLRFAASGGAASEVAYQVRATPAETPSTYEAHVVDRQSGEWTDFTFEPEWQRMKLAVPGHAVTFFHNPDGSYSVGDKVFSSVQQVAETLVADAGLARLPQTLLVAATISVGDAVRMAGTRIADGWCDPAWFLIDPDCKGGFAPPVMRSYACNKWGSNSLACMELTSYGEKATNALEPAVTE